MYYLKLFIFGLVIHLILLYAVFDVYYVSPIVQNARSHTISLGKGPSERLVVFSADGLRSRTFYDHPEKSRFLHGLIKNNNAIYGISKSHVPTESRPGHVAIFAGFFEDVSAVTKGWKHNPIKFDSVFNQTSRAWLFGSPDIVLMFGEELKHATTFHYSSNEEQFFDSDAAGLDRWVFDKVKDLFANKTEGLDQPKTIFFLHLLGIDSNGHGHKPYSQQYLDNIRIVDDGVREIFNLFEEHFGDKKTAYLFTSDHGMTDYGSHGAGEDDEILTPLVAWGSGIRSLPSIQVINQIDLTPFQSAILNVPVPTNNFGILPLHFLNVTSKYKFQSACGNLKQMVEQYGIKRAEKLANSLPFMFRDFPDFKASALTRVEESISQLAEKKRYDFAATKCIEWIPNVRKAFIYFHRYHRKTLGIALSIVFILWNSLLYSTFSKSNLHVKSSLWMPNNIFNFVILIEICLGLYQKWSIMHLSYIILPVYLASLITNLLNLTIQSIVDNFLNLYQNFSGQLFAYLIGLAILMSAFVSAFFNRGIVSGILVFMASTPYLASINTKWSKIWSISCLFLAIFPQCAPVGQTPLTSLTVISPLLASLCLYFYKKKYSKSSNLIFDFYIVANAMTSIIILYSNFYWTNMSKTPNLVKAFSWFSITLNLMIPLFSDNLLCDRIVLWMAAVNVPYSLMSLSYECIFFLIFCILLFAYIQIECVLGTERLLTLRYSSKKPESTIFGPFKMVEWRRTIAFLALIEVAFFGTGNLSSLNSFNPSFTRNFISTFSPFVMTALLVIKIVLPFFILSCVFCLILNADGRQLPARLAVLLFITTDLMAMVFFHFLKDDGSWLEIGTSISNYVICMLFAAICFILLHISNKIYMVKLLNSESVKSLDNNKVFD